MGKNRFASKKIKKNPDLSDKFFNELSRFSYPTKSMSNNKKLIIKATKTL
jgi:hypothetical protein